MSKMLIKLSGLMVCLFLLWSIGLLWFITSIPTQNEETAIETEAIVVLTGGSERLREGIKLLEQKQGKYLFISGVDKQTQLHELAALSKELTPENVRNYQPYIILGHAAYDTISNAKETKNWVEKEAFSSVRLVTANYHMPRSLTIFRLFMPKITIIAHPVFPEQFKSTAWWRYPGTLRLILSEYHKYLAFWVYYWYVESSAS